MLRFRIYITQKGEIEWSCKREALLQVNHTSQFEKLDASNVIRYTPYEYGSVMHYGANAFVKEEKKDEITIMPKKKRYLRTIGSPIPSLYDMMMVNKYYNCSGVFNFDNHLCFKTTAHSRPKTILAMCWTLCRSQCAIEMQYVTFPPRKFTGRGL
ncbi:astacin [Cooperia oncophora]